MTQGQNLRTAQVVVAQEDGANDAKAQLTTLLECRETALRYAVSDHGLGIHARALLCFIVPDRTGQPRVNQRQHREKRENVRARPSNPNWAKPIRSAERGRDQIRKAGRQEKVSSCSSWFPGLLL